MRFRRSSRRSRKSSDLRIQSPTRNTPRTYIIIAHHRRQYCPNGSNAPALRLAKPRAIDRVATAGELAISPERGIRIRTRAFPRTQDDRLVAATGSRKWTRPSPCFNRTRCGAAASRAPTPRPPWRICAKPAGLIAQRSSARMRTRVIGPNPNSPTPSLSWRKAGSPRSANAMPISMKRASVAPRAAPCSKPN